MCYLSSSVSIACGTHISNAICSRYEAHPSQETLVLAISISRAWSIPRLFDYTLDNLTRQSKEGRIHPAVVLGLARKYGIPELIEPSVKALGKLDIQFSSWSTDQDIICHNTVIELGVIGKMKEKILITRMSLCSPPSPIHDKTVCRPDDHSTCATFWRTYWQRSITPKLLRVDGQVADELWAIKTKLETEMAPGMKEGCARLTVEIISGKPAWNAERNIQAGATDLLMVAPYSNVDPTW